MIVVSHCKVFMIEWFFPNMVDVTALKRYNLPIGGWVNGRIR